MRTAIGIVASVLAAGAAAAQGVIPPGAERPVAPTGSTVQGQEVEGTISRIDRAARAITLDNGVEYLIVDPANLLLPALKEGMPVKLRYDVDGGRNTVTFLDIAR